MIRMEDVDKVYRAGTINETRLFEKFNLTVETGSFVSVVGSNGSGKTTMLNLMAGTIPMEGGRIVLDDADITAWPAYKRARRIGRVFQDPSMGTVPAMTILENLSLAANKGKPYRLGFAVNRRDRACFGEMVRGLGLGLEEKLDTPVGHLSGGQRQALALLMTTLTPVDLLLLDEHTAALDPKTAEVIMELTDRVVKENRLTTLMVTHNLRYAVEYGDRLLMMHSGRAVLDRSGEEKVNTRVEDVLELFNSISIECGN